MEKFTKEELMTIYFALMTSILREQKRLRQSKNEKLREALTNNIKKYDDLSIKVSEMGKELCTK